MNAPIATAGSSTASFLRLTSIEITPSFPVTPGQRVAIRVLATSLNGIVSRSLTVAGESIALPPGEYQFRIAREYDPYAELARQSMD